jgi:hypothetical protein
MRFIWNNLNNKRKYVIPTTIDELQKIGFLSPCIEINGERWYFSSNKDDLFAMVEIIYNQENLQPKLSTNTVYKSITKELEKQFTEEQISFEDSLEAIIARVTSNIKQWEILFSIEGLKLVDIDQVEVGGTTIFVVTNEIAQEILNNMKPEHGRESFKVPTSEFIKNNLLNKTTIKCHVEGDYDKAVQNARSIAQQSINFFRFLTCVIAHQRIAENIVKINLSPEAYTSRDVIFAIDLATGYPTLSTSRGRRSFEAFPISASRIEELTQNHLLPFITMVLTNPNISELEGTILTALHWIGEAQNEFDLDVAFIKYWTMIESVFTAQSETIQHSLASSTSVIIKFSGYAIDEKIDPGLIYRRMKKLYDKRSDIIHRGLRGNVTYGDLGEICKYSAWAILALVDLSIKGYSKMDQIRPEIDRLYKIINDKGDC